jgi:V/A-type H+-transporting ATPase subunit C
MLGFKYVSIYPKIMAWRSSILKEEEIREAMELDLKSLIDFIKGKLRKVSITNEDIISVERAIRQEEFLFLKSVENFLYGNSKKFFKSWLKAYEIENIKLILKSIILEKKEFLELLFNLGGTSKFQVEFVREINTIDEFLDFLSGTEYYKIARDTFPRVKESKATFFFDVALDNYFAFTLKRFYDSLFLTEKKSIKELLFYFIESKRIVSLYRARFYFNFSKNECMVLVPEILGILSQSRYEKLLDVPTEEEFLKLLSEWRLISIDANTEILESSIEYYFLKELLKRAKRGMKSGFFNLSLTLSFFILHYLNIKNWIALLEAKKEGISVEDTLKFLVF